jgi:MFS family permease
MSDTSGSAGSRALSRDPAGTWPPAQRKAEVNARIVLGICVASGLIHAPNQVMTLAEASDKEGRGVAAGFFQLSQRLACSIGMSWGAVIFLLKLNGGGSLAAYRSAFVAALALVLLLCSGALLAAVTDACRRRSADRRKSNESPA